MTNYSNAPSKNVDSRKVGIASNVKEAPFQEMDSIAKKIERLLELMKKYGANR